MPLPRLSLAALGVLIALLPSRAEDPSGQPGGAAPGLSRAAVRRQVEGLRRLGETLFSDPRLSGSRQLACASCHDPAHAFGPPNGAPVQLGGGDMRQAGLRAVPSLTYLNAVPAFTEHHFDSEDEADESVDNGPTGGLTWDGRIDRARDQALIPLLSPFEMGNRDRAEIASRLLEAGYGSTLVALAPGGKALDDATIVATAAHALEVFQQDHKRFYPYSSKYDAVLAGRATLSPEEAEGLALFNDPAKGNCASCHISERAKDGEPPQFSDYGLIALAVPRNPDIPANRDPGYFDLGLCGPLRRDFMDRRDYCGLFRTPSLRNVADRTVFFHNGAVHSLRDAVRFYVERETRPENWYPRKPDGGVAMYDDLPEVYRDNINRDPPFDRKPGDKPALDDREIDAVVAFLKTLSDGTDPRAAP
jgi:cytochrome c peroxidase